MLKQFRASELENFFVVGSFTKKVTVLQQQIRALNLVHHLVEDGAISRDKEQKIAVIGAGFAGLTVAAGIISKTSNSSVSIFERRDSLIPLQQGSDSRWLHPTIYDWPDGRSASNSAMLPLLNWTSGRASDVAVQVLENWRQIIDKDVKRINLYCNVRHVKCQPDKKLKKITSVEWIGDSRDPRTGMQSAVKAASIGDTREFDIIIACVGFGLEENSTSYWRNETLAQPSLGARKNKYLISGSGDGGIIDLLRARIQNFRQDRVLGEIFTDAATVAELKKLKARYDSPKHVNLFGELSKIERSSKLGGKLNEVIEAIKSRLRSDSDVIFNTKFDSVADLFEDFEKKVSFQNAILLYCLYRAGGFTPVGGDLTEVRDKLVERHDIPLDHVVVRHGTKREEQLARLLAGVKPKEIKALVGDLSSQPGETIAWQAGYFGFKGKWDERKDVGEDTKASWRKEYLPAATEIAASSLCGSVCSIFERAGTNLDNYRVTFHRSLLLFNETVLQQCCRYMGEGVGDADTAARTFLTGSASIGLCYGLRSAIRTREGVSRERIYEVMDDLSLHEAAREMRQNVRSIACVPILQPTSEFFGSGPVSGILYFDSADANAFVDDEAMIAINRHLVEFVKYLESETKIPSGFKNVNFSPTVSTRNSTKKLPAEIADCFEIVDVGPLAKFSGPTFINLDQTSYAV